MIIQLEQRSSYPFPVDTPKGTKISITGGSYNGRKGYFLNWTVKRVNVGIHLSPTLTIIRCLARTNVELLTVPCLLSCIPVPASFDPPNRIAQLFQARPSLENNLQELCEAFTQIGVSVRDEDFLDMLVLKFAESQRKLLHLTLQTCLDVDANVTAKTPSWNQNKQSTMSFLAVFSFHLSLAVVFATLKRRLLTALKRRLLTNAIPFVLLLRSLQASWD